MRYDNDEESNENAMIVKDCNGNILNDGDAVQLTKDLNVKGCSLNLKRGAKMKKIRLIEGDTDNIECREGKTTIVIKTCFLKKV